ncbi:hypothetical protein [Salinimonas lutimaris]|uniref:hypothetical protein n=1 Tax=Salinimonas lutimaris TaxID=914153 RepID=UPI0010C023E5|nr:hypothetical protein [Salinimonas lutimaris]
MAASKAPAKRWALFGSGVSAGMYLLVTLVFTGAEAGCPSLAESATEAPAGQLPAVQSLASCQSKPEISWQAWVVGNSPSYQFHFYDLLELLYGGNNDGQFNAAPKGTR